MRKLLNRLLVKRSSIQMIESGGNPQEFTRALSLITGLEELLNNEIGKIRTMTGTERVAVLVSNGHYGPYTVRASRGYGESDIADVVFRDDARLVKWLQTNETFLIPSESPEIVAFLRPEERECLARLAVEAVFPLLASNRLVGMIFAARPGGLPSGQVESLLELLPSMALALENAILYERQQLRIRRLYRAERLATTGQLAAGAAHEIRNPLTSISSTIQYLGRRLSGDPELSDMVTGLIEETDRINAIVEGMLSLARRSNPRFETLDLCEVISQTVRLIEPTARKTRIEIETQMPQHACNVCGDPDQLKQVFLNMMMNSVQAMPNGGCLRIVVSACKSGSLTHRWRIEIADTGIGISVENLEKAFDPFFTTKVDGTGLGLSICYAILQEHRGEIEVESAVGQGTQVVVRL